MRKPITTFAALILAGAAHSGELTLQLKWLPQAQFAGYYVAQSKGFYEEEGLDVTIKPGGPGIAPTQVLAEGGADVIVEWMAAALAAREKGLPLVNIAQPFKSSGLMLTCLKAAGIIDPATDLAGKTVGTWFNGNEYPMLNWLHMLDLPTDGGPDGVTLVAQGSGVDLLLQKRAACISSMSYNEYWQLIEAGIAPEDLTAFRYEEHGAATLEDGLYALEGTLADEAGIAELAKFVRASMKGWRYAEAHPEEAAEIVLERDETDSQTVEQQTRMMTEVTKLTAGTDGILNETDYQRSVDILLAGGSVISARLEGAWTHKVTDEALAALPDDVESSLNEGGENRDQ